jgi:putative inorganic carbon (HCO3(-)) transporter
MPQGITTRRVMTPFVGALGLALLSAAITVLPTPTAVLVIAGAFLSLALVRWRELAFYLLIFAIPFGSLVPVPLGGANVTAADGLLLLALALWLAHQISRRRIIFRSAPLLIPFVIFIFAASVSLTVALSLQAAAKELAKWIEMLAIYWLVVQEFGPVQVKRALAAMFCAGLAEAALGFYQFFFRVGPEGFLLFGGSNLRAFGTFEQPNPYAGYLGLVIPLAFGVALGLAGAGLVGARGRVSAGALVGAGVELPHHHGRANYWRYVLFAVAVAALVATLMALFFSLSRGAWIGVAAALVVTTIIRSKRAAALALTGAFLLASLVLLGQLNLIPDVVSERFSGVGDYFGFEDVRGVAVNDANFAIVERKAHWQAAWDMFNDHPWLGVGIGNYAAAYPAYALPRWDDPLGHAHNYYLNVLAESGIVGLGAYLVLWGAIFWTAWRAVRSTRGWEQGLAAGAFGVLVALSIHNLFDNLFVHSMQMEVGVTLGLIQVQRRGA